MKLKQMLNKVYGYAATDSFRIEDHDLTQEDYNSWIEYGRMRRIVKSIDCYACVYERDGKRFAAFSTGLTVQLDKFKGISTPTVKGWLLALYLISKDRKVR